MTLVEQHFKKTAELVRAIDKKVIASWLLTEGYFPEQYVLPPSFTVKDFHLKEEPYNSDVKKLKRKNLVTISYPKSFLTSRVFGIQHPRYYHDIVFYLIEGWEEIVSHIFHSDLKIFSYSFPIPVNGRTKGKLSTLRSGRMIYEWIEMAEKDMVAEAHQFNFIIRADITNFYNSVYTHSIGWALHGRDGSLGDKELCKLMGSKIDRLVQYANDARTIGIPVGSALSDLVAEIILAKIDREVSLKLNSIKFIGSRFKDDYRILCNTEDDAKKILKILSDELIKFNLLINEHKTKVLTLPNGLYRQHDREYHNYTLRDKESIPFKVFELTLLKALDIHKAFPGTSILEKFFSELYDNNSKLKVQFSDDDNRKKKQILKAMSLLMMAKRESEKTLCHVLAILEDIYNDNRPTTLKEQYKSLIKSEIRKASEKKSEFELVWLVFFSRYLSLGFKESDFKDLIDKELQSTESFLNSIVSSKQQFFKEQNLFSKPRDCKTQTLSKRLAVFGRNKE